MFLFGLLRRWFSRSVPTRHRTVGRRAPARRNNLAYEGLEDRRLLSAITKVQDFAGSQFQSGATSYSLSVPAAVAAGHTLLIEVALDTSGTVSVTDSAGDTFTNDSDNNDGAGPKTRELVYHSVGVKGLSAGQSITVSFPSTAIAKAVAVQEFSGITSLSPFDETVAGHANSASPSSGTLANNTAQANELLLGAVSLQNGSSTAVSFTAGTGYMALSSATTTDASGPNQQILPEYEVVSASNKYGASGTLGSVQQWEGELVTYKADTATHYAISGVPSSTTTGSAFNITVTAEDSSNATVAGYAGTVHFTSSDVQAGLPSDYAFTSTDAGMHTFSVTLKTVGSQTITATDKNDGTVNATTSAIAVNVGATTKLAVSGPGSATAGNPFNTLTVTAEDAYGNTTPAYVGTVHFTGSDGSAVLPADYTFTSANAGVQTFSVTLKASGSQTVTATDTVTSSIAGTSGAISVAAASATSFSISAPTNAIAGAASNVTITAQDAFGNTAAAYTGTVHFTSSDGSAVLPANYTFVAGDAGVKTVSLTLKTSGNQTLTATDTASNSIAGTSGVIAVAAASTATLSVSAPASSTAGNSFNVTVTAKDQYGNVATGYTGTIHFSSTDGSASLPSDYTFVGGDAGVHTFSVTLKTSGNQTLTATDTASGTVTGTSGTIAVAAASAASVSVIAPANATAGTAFNVTVTALDAYGNTATGYVGDIHFTSSDGSALLPGDYTFGSANAGTATFSVTLKTAGTRTITATDTVSGSITGTSTAVSVAAASATTLSISAPASATAGTAFNVTVTVEDAYGNTATGYTGTVRLTSTDGSAVLPANYTFVASDAGIHTFSVTMKTAGNQTVTVTDTATSSISSTSGAIAISAAAASNFTLAAPTTITAGTSFNVTITAKDQYGNVATGYTGTIHVTSTDGQAVLPSNYTFVSGDAGVHTVSVILKTSGNQTLTASDTVTSSLTGTTSGIAVAASAATHINVTAPTNATAGSAFNLTVTALDAYGNTAAGYVGTVSFTSSDVAGVLPADYTFSAGNAGIGTFSVDLKTSGNQTVSATDTASGSITGTSGVIAVAPASATAFVVSRPSNITAGSAFSVTITAKDAYGNIATGYTGTVHFTSSDSAAVLPATYTFVAGDAGVKTVSVTLKSAGSQTVTATDTVTGSIAGTSGAITVAAGTASTLSVSAPVSGTAGTAFSVTITATDPYGNIAAGYTGTVRLTSSDAQAGLPSNYTFVSADGGMHTLSVTLKTSGNQTITATDTVTGSITGATGNIAVAAAAATTLMVTTPANATAGTAFNVTLKALDAYGNTATGYDGTVHFTSSDPTAGLPSDYTFAATNAGIATFSITPKTAGNRTITATDTATSSLTGTTGTITVAAAGASTFSLSTSANATAGSALNVTLTAKDPYGNTAAGYTGTVRLTSSDAQAVLPADYTFVTGDAGIHTLSVTLKTSGNQTLTATDTADGSIAGATSTSVAATSTTHFAVSAPANVSAGSAFNVTITALDAYGNQVSGYVGTVHLTSTDGAALLPADYTFVASDAGTHVLSATLKTAGNQTITATDTATGSVTGATSTIAVAAASATHFTVTAPANITAGSAFNVALTALDAYGNTATAYTGTVHFSSTDAAALLPADYTFSAGNAGTGVFSVTLKTAGGQTITATDRVTSSIAGTSGNVTTSAAAASTFALTAPSTVIAGSSFNFNLTALDPYGNTVTGYTGTIRFSSSDASAALPANSTLTNGLGSFTATLKTSGNQTLTASDTLTSSLAVTSGPIATANAAASQLTIVAPASVAVGVPFNVTVTARDAYGNAAVDYAGTAHFTSSDVGAVLPADSTLDAGTGTFSVTFTTSGSQTLTATDTVTGSITGTSSPISSVAATTHLSVSAPATATAGTPFNVTITALDQYGNVATDYSGTVHFASTDGQAVLPGDYTFSAGNAGVATFAVTLKTTGSQTITATDDVTASIRGISGTIATLPAATSRFSISAPANNTAGNSSSVTVTALDPYGNTTTAYAGSVHFTSSDSQSVLPANSTLSSGSGTFSVTLKTAGNQTIAASDTATGLITGTSSGVAVSASSATHFGLIAPTNVTAATAFNVAVTALDSYGNIATSYAGTVHFTSIDAAAALPANSTLTNGAGTFSVTLKTAGSQTVAATDTSDASLTGTSNSVAVAPAAATHFIVSAAGAATAGSAFNVTVTALDASGNIVTGYSGNIHFTSTDGGAVLPGDYTFSAGNAGVATFAMTLTTAGNQTITATDTTNGQLTGTTGTIAVAAAAASHFGVAAAANATAGTAFTVTVTALDPYGNTATAYTGTIYFTSSDAQAALPADYTFAAADAGTAAFSATLKTSGGQTLSVADATVGSISGMSNTIATAAAVAARFSLAAPGTATAGTAFNITVTALDQYGNVATGYSGTVRFSSSDGAAALPANSTLTNGVATFSVTQKTSGTQSLTATDTVTGSLAGTSGTIATSAAAATHFAVSAPANTTAGSAFNVTVTALDAYGNLATGYAGTVHFTSGDAAAALPVDYTFSSANAGANTFSATLKTAGTFTITAKDTVTSSIAGASASIDDAAAAATHFAVSAPSTATAGNSFNLTVTALDAYGNTATAYTGTVQFTSSDGAAVLPTNRTLAAGTATLSVTLKTAGSQTLTATDTGNGSVAGTCGPISTSAAAATHFTVAVPSSAAVGLAFNATVTAQDAYGNTVTNYAGTVHFTSTDAAAVLPADSTLTGGVGTFVVILKTVGNQSLTATDNASGTMTGTSGTIATIAAAATHFLVVAPATDYAGAAFMLTVTALDPYGNTDNHYTGSVHFTSSDGSAELPADYTFTTANAGTHTFSIVLKTSGNQTVTATDTVSGAMSGTSGTIDTAPANDTHFVFSGPATATAGTPFNITVTAEDALGNTDTSYSGTLHFSSSDGSAVLPSDTGLADGTGTFSVTLKTSGTQTMTAVDTSDNSIDGSALVTVAAAPANQLLFAAPVTATAGASFNATLTAEDPYGNIDSSYVGTVHFSSGDGAAVLPSDYTFAGANHGVANFSFTLKTSGDQTITATDTVTASITGNTGAVATAPAVATHLAVTVPVNAAAGSAFNVTVTALDAYGNTATGYTGTVHFSSSDGAAVLPANSTLTDGTATLSVALKTSGNQTITASDSVAGSLNGTSSPIATAPAAATHFIVTAPAEATVGAALNVTVTALDAYGNTATAYSGTVHFTSSDAGATLPADVSLAAGVGTASITLKTSGNQTVTATDTVAASITGTSAGIATTAGAATHYSVSAPGSVTAGVAFNVTVTALDAFGNTATGYDGSVHFTSTDAAAVLPGDSTLAGGVGTFNFMLKTSGSQTVGATGVEDGLITGTSAMIATSPAAAVQLAVSAPASATAGGAFNVVVTALDAYGNTASGYTGTVHFTSNDGSAVLPADSTLTAGSGTFSVTLATAGNRTIAATDNMTGSISGVSAPIAVAASSATRFNVSQPAGTSAGTAFNVTITALDAYGNTATSYTGSVHFTSSDAQAALPADYTFAAANAGVATFSVTLKAAGAQTITAADTVTGSIDGTSGTISVAPGAATHYSISAPTLSTAGSAFSISVTALDAYGNTAAGYSGSVEFTSSDAAAVLPANSTLTNGTGSFSVTLNTAGNRTITATDTVSGSIAGTSAAIDTATAAATHFAVSATTTAVAGSALSFTVTALDNYGNTVTGYNGTVHFTSTDAEATLPADVSLANGAATFSATLKTAGNQTIAAMDTVNGSITGTSPAIAVSAAAATRFAVSAPTNATAGSAISLTVTALDQYGNVATGYTGTVHFSSSDAAAVLSADSTLSDGVRTLSVTLKTSGNATVAATDTVNGSINGTSSTIATSPAAASQFMVTAPTTATAGTAFNVTVTALDPYGNIASGYGGTVHFTSSDAAAALSADGTLINGVGTFSTTLKTAGSQSVTATDTATASIRGAGPTINTSPAAATHYALTAPASATAGLAFDLSVTALDAYGNTATAYAGTVHFTSSDSAAVLPANSTLTGGVGTFSVTLKTSGIQTLSANDVADGSVVGTTGSIATAAASATAFVVSAPVTATAGTEFNLTITAHDAYGNIATGYIGTVTFSSTDGAAELPASYAFSGLNAGAETFAAALKTVGNQSVTVTDAVNGSIRGVSGAVAVAPNVATHFAVTAPASATAGSAINVSVTALDAYGNTATGYSGTAHFTSSDSRAVLPADSTLANGVGSFSATFKTSGNRTITAGDAASGSIDGTSSSIAIAAAGAASFTVAAAADATAGSPFSVLVTARDPYGNVATGYAGRVTFNSSDAAAVLPANTTLAAGAGTFNVTLKTAASQTITATDTVAGSIAGTSGSIVTSAAVATHFSVAAPTNAVAGTAFNITVTALDAYGNTATDYDGRVHFTSSDTQAVLPANGTLTAGIGTFSVTLKSSGSQTVSAIDTAVASISGTSSAVATTALAATHFSVIAPAATTAGSAFNITVEALDPYGNIATSYSGTVHFTSSAAAAVLHADTTLSGGAGTFNTILKTAGNQSITATDTVTGPISGSSPTISVLPAAATQFRWTAPTGATAGAAFIVTITALDGYGNAATGYVGTVHFSSSDLAAALPGDYTFSGANAGTGTFSVTLKSAGNQTLNVADAVTHTISASSNTIAVVPGAVSQFLVASPAAIVAGSSFNFSVSAMDACGNPVSGFSGTVAFASSDNQAALPANGALSGGTGSFSATLKTAGSQTITVRDVATGSITGTSDTAVTADAANSFKVTSPNNAVVGVGFPITVTARDAYGNVAAGYSGSVQFASSDGAAALPPNTTLTSGTGIFSLTLNTVGIQTITATDTSTASIAGSSGPIGVSLMPVTGFTVTAPANVQPGTPFNVTVKVVDADGDPITTYTGTVHFSSIDNTAVLPGDYTFGAADGGTATFTATLNAPGTDTVMVTDTVHPAILGVSGAINVAAPTIIINGTSIAGYAGTPLANVVLADFSCTDNSLSAAAFQATVDWGDGTTSTGQVTATANGYQVVGSHGYSGMGPYKITITASSALAEAQVRDAASIAAPLLSDGTRGTANERLVSALFYELLGRPVEPGGLSYFTNLLDQGAPPSEIVQQITTSTEYLTNEANSLFEQYLHRGADPAGLAWATGLLVGGGTVEQLAIDMIGSPEYVEHRSGGRADLFLENLYHDALGRDIDAGALGYYEQLMSASASPSQIAGYILDSGEYRADDLDAQFHRLLNRGADLADVATLAVDLSTGPSTRSVMTLIAELPVADSFFQFITS